MRNTEEPNRARQGQAPEPKRKPEPERPRKRKKKRSRIKRKIILFLILLLIIAVAVLTLLYGDKLGLGDGFGFLPGVQSGEESGDPTGAGEDTSNVAPTAEATPVPTAEELPAVGDAFISVNETTIKLNNTEVTLEGLQLQLTGPYKGAKVTLKDDYALMETYESVQNLLTQLGITYQEQGIN